MTPNAPTEAMFVQPQWLSTCLSCWPASLGWQHRVLRQTQGASAELLLGRRLLTRHAGLLRSRVLSLNQSLDAAWDQVFVEFNGFFGTPRSEFAAVFESLLSEVNREPDWDEFRLFGLQAPEARHVLEQAPRWGLRARVLDERPSWSRALSGPDTPPTVLAQLSSNSRQQIRRSMRDLVARHGPLTLDVARSTSQAQAWFEEIGPWHRQRWSRPVRGAVGSGFDNPAFVHFHRTLMDHAFDAGLVRVWKLFSGERLISMMYNFRVGSRESFYLGATDPTLDPALRPGLVGHLSVMQRCLDEGMAVYDFMAGDAQYKRQLSNRRETLFWLVLQRPRWRFRIEDRLRTLRDALRARPDPSTGDAPDRPAH